MRNLIFLCGFLIWTASLAQITPPAIAWQNSLGGPGNDGVQSAILDQDNNIVFAGVSGSVGGDVNTNQGGSDFWVVKTTKTGNVIWEKSFGGSGGDSAKSIGVADDGGYIVMGTSTSNDGDVPGNKGGIDILIIKISKDGDLEWSKNFGGTDDDTGTAIVKANQGYLVTGYSYSNDGDLTMNQGMLDLWVFKIDLNGQLIWQKNLGGSKIDAGFAATAIEGGYLVAGETFSNDGDVGAGLGEYDGWILKLDEDGNILWKKHYGGTGDDNIRTISATKDGGFVIGGFSRSVFPGSPPKGWDDFWFAKMDSNGNVQWQKTYGGSGVDYGYAIKEMTDGSYWIAGSSMSFDGDVKDNYGGRDCFVGKLDTNGNLLFGRNYGGSGNDECFSIVELQDGVVVLGRSKSNDFDVIGNHGGYDAWMMKFLDNNLQTSDTAVQNTVSIYPNPAKDILNVKTNDQVLKVEVYAAASGQLLKTLKGKIFNVSSLPSGIYLLKITTNKQVISKKIIIE